MSRIPIALIVFVLVLGVGLTVVWVFAISRHSTSRLDSDMGPNATATTNIAIHAL